MVSHECREIYVGNVVSDRGEPVDLARFCVEHVMNLLEEWLRYSLFDSRCHETRCRQRPNLICENQLGRQFFAVQSELHHDCSDSTCGGWGRRLSSNWKSGLDGTAQNAGAFKMLDASWRPDCMIISVASTVERWYRNSTGLRSLTGWLRFPAQRLDRGCPSFSGGNSCALDIFKRGDRRWWWRRSVLIARMIWQTDYA